MIVTSQEVSYKQFVLIKLQIVHTIQCNRTLIDNTLALFLKVKNIQNSCMLLFRSSFVSPNPFHAVMPCAFHSHLSSTLASYGHVSSFA